MGKGFEENENKLSVTALVQLLLQLKLCQRVDKRLQKHLEFLPNQILLGSIFILHVYHSLSLGHTR